MSLEPPALSEGNAEAHRRSEVIESYDILDSSPEDHYDNIAELAAGLCNAPVARVSIVAGDRQWFKARVGSDVCESPLTQSFCKHAILQRGLFIVPNAAEDPRFCDTPHVAGEPYFRFYAAAVLVTPENLPIGTLCVLDYRPRTLTPKEESALLSLARQVMALLELRRTVRAMTDGEQRLRCSELSYRRLFEAARDGILILEVETGRITDANPFLVDLLGFTKDEILGKTVGELSPFKDIEDNQAMLEKLQAKGHVRYEDLPLQTKEGETRAVEFVSNVYDAGDKRVIQCNIRDITERKSVSEQLNLLKTCVSHFNDVLIITESAPIEEPGPRIVFANEAFESLTGYAMSETLGKSPRILQGKNTDKATLDLVRQALVDQKPVHVQIINYKKTGEEYWMDINIVPVFNSRQDCTHFAAIERDVTESKRTSESLRLFRTLMDRSPDAIEVIDPETGLFLDVNEMACTRLGYTREEMLQLRLPDIVELDATPFSMRQAFTELKQGGFKIVESRHRRKDGSTFPIEANIQHLNLDRAYIVAVVRDISERKRAEGLLRERSEQLRLYTENTPAATAMFDHDMRYLVVSRGWMEAYRLGDRNIIGLSHYEVFPEVPQRWKDIYRRCLAGAVEKCEEDSFLREDGRIDWIRWEVRPWRQADGQTGGIVMFSEDITERKTAEVARQVIEARYRLLVESNVQGVFFWNKEGEITGANDAFLHLVRHSREDMEARRINWVALTPSEYETLDRGARAEVAAKGMCAPYEKEYVLTDGSRVPILLGSASFKDDPSQGVSFVLDLTERKRIEQQFLRAQRLESIGTLAGGIAHDLNNVLSPILMGASLLRLGSPSDKTKAVIDIIESSATRGADLVKQVLSFARGVEGAKIAVHIGDVVDELRTLISSTFPKNIRFEANVPSDVWLINSDPTQIHQVLLNLCVNARDAMNLGGRLTIDVQNVVIEPQNASQQIGMTEGRYIRIRVSDTGAGIKKEILDKIFDPFFTTKDLGRGTGLGLATSMGIIRMNGGSLTVKSEVGIGTVFTIDLPVPLEKTESRPVVCDPSVPPRGNGEWVLLVDDENAILNITQRTLEAFGYRVLTAENGALAVGIFARHQQEIAVVIMDMMMPVMDGPASILALHQIDPEVKVIAASGLKDKATADGCVVGGVKYFLSKPYSTVVLLEALHLCLAEKRE